MPGTALSDYNPNQHATYSQMAAYLSSKAGLDYQVALNWVHAEGSTIPNNPLGMTDNKGHFLTYGSWQAGLDGAIQNLKTNSVYARVRQAIDSGTPAEQRAAIVGSPWAAGNYNGGNGFSTAGISGGSPTIASSPSSSSAPFNPATFSYGQQVATAPIKLQNVIPDLFGTLFAWVPGFAANGLVVVVILGLAFMGTRDLLGD